MPDINILSPHVADLIAAGEVVERPASVIKELCENSIDADARNITIEIKGGGMTYIRVTDDGFGMTAEDAGICFVRHATSKLHNERGLEAIGTMGFRGEALAAISSVSRIEMQTKKRCSNEGTRITLEAGDIIEMAPCGCPEGTTIIIRDLFYNTPARQKFMKSDRAESSACTNASLHCALAKPNISVRLIKDGNDEFFSPGDGKILSAVYSLLGRETANELLKCSSDDEYIKVKGYIGSPKNGHGNRGKQYLFCNGRSIKSPALTTAVERAYKNTLLTGRFPSFVLYIETSPASVDVNVHPAKTEIKFRQEKRTFDAVYYATLSALQNESTSEAISLSKSTKKVISPKGDFYKTMSSEDFRKQLNSTSKNSNQIPIKTNDTITQTQQSVSFSSPKESSSKDLGTIFVDTTKRSSSDTRVCESKSPYFAQSSPGTVHHYEPEKLTEEVEKSSYISQEDKTAPSIILNEKANNNTDSSTVEESQNPFHDVIPDFRLVGETMKTYIIIEQDEKLILIDKHAAHERMIFDRLKKQQYNIMSQSLLVPIPIKLTEGYVELIEHNSQLLNDLGFEIDIFGTDSVMLRSVPADTDEGSAKAMVEEICDKLAKGDKLSPTDITDEILHTVACKAAIKAGYNTTDDELKEIAKHVLSGEVKYCPHGRPVSIELTRKDLDKKFSRIV